MGYSGPRARRLIPGAQEVEHGSEFPQELRNAWAAKRSLRCCVRADVWERGDGGEEEAVARASD